MKGLLIFILSLTSTTALAHSGHLSNESVHGFLHIEHIIVLAAFGLIVLITKVWRNK